jgi:lysophospholipase L1-like esterase
MLVASACGGHGTPSERVAEAGSEPDASEVDAASQAPIEASTDEATGDAGAPATRDASSDDAGAADGTPDGGGGAYEPCPPAGTACAVMPLGDSITDGTTGSSIGGGYRVSLFHRARADRKTITFVGSGSDGPATVDGVPFPPHHEGHSGYVIGGGSGGLSFLPGIAPLVVNAVTTYRPNIVTLMISTNDVNLNDDLANAPARLAALMDSIVQTDPRVLLVVARITPTQSDAENASVQAYNAAIPSLVQARAAAGEHVVMVDMYASFTADANYKTADLSDNVHPNDAWYERMAGVWYAAIGPLFR